MDTRSTKYIKPLSKEWWENIWYYYKNFIIVGIIVVIALAMLISECHYNSSYDCSAYYMGGVKQMNYDGEYGLEDALSPAIPDYNGDKETRVNVELMHLDSTSTSQDMMTMFQLADAQMSGGETAVFLFDEEFLERYSKFGYYDLTEWATKYGIAEEHLKRYENGAVYGIELVNHSVINSVKGLEPDGLYIAVRPLRESDTKKSMIRAHEIGLELAQYIISDGEYTPVYIEK